MATTKSSRAQIAGLVACFALIQVAVLADADSGAPAHARTPVSSPGSVTFSDLDAESPLYRLHSPIPANRSTVKAVDLCAQQDALGCWADGSISQIYLPNCSAGGTDNGNGLVTAYSGNWIADDGSYPATGDLYWGHVVIGFGVWPCPGAEPVVSAEVQLPPASALPLDLSLADDVGRTRCVRTSYLNDVPNPSINFTGQSGPGFSCPSKPFTGSFGQVLGYTQMAASPGRYMIQEFIFPVRTARPLFGIASSNDRVRARVSINFDSIETDNWVIVGRSRISLSGRRSGSKIRVDGTVAPRSKLRSAIAGARQGTRLSIEFKAKRGKKAVSLGRRSVVPSATGAFTTSFLRRSGTTRCQVRADWGGATQVSRSVPC